MDIHDVCDYIIHKVCTSGESLSNLKLQKLLYYVQAWNIVFEGKPLFAGKFQAWVHDPVSRDIYNRFAKTKTLYSDINENDVRNVDHSSSIDESAKSHIDRVLSVYAKFSGAQLEELTHQEQPWLEARKGYEPFQRCEVELDENLMGDYYKQRLN